MNRNLKASLFFTFSLSLVSAFSLWLFYESDSEMVERYTIKYEELRSFGRIEEAQNLLNSVFYKNNSSDYPLKLHWLPLAKKIPNGYVRIALYLRFLKNSPHHEKLYLLLEQLIQKIPKKHLIEVKNKLINDLNEIEKIDKKALKRYGLLKKI